MKSLILIVVLVVAAPAWAQDGGAGTGYIYEPVSVLGDSWCQGLQWFWAAPSTPAGQAFAMSLLDLHCQNASTTLDWPVARVLDLELHRVVYIQLGGNDVIRWIVLDDRDPRSTWYPARAARRLRWIIQALQRRGHEVYVLGYEATRTSEQLGAIAELQVPFCPYPEDRTLQPVLGPDGLHLTIDSYVERGRWLVVKGCHR